MPWYKIDIDGKVYIGEYRSLDNAVFGAMRRDDNWRMDKCLIGAEKIADHPPRGMSKAEFTRKLRTL